MNNYYILLYCLYAFGQAIFTERILEEDPSNRDADAVWMMALIAPLVSVMLVIAFLTILINRAIGKKWE